MDTGAQQESPSVRGSRSWTGPPPRVARWDAPRGIGGSATLISHISVPSRLDKIHGIIRMSPWGDDVGFRAIGWRAPMQALPSGHLDISMMDFAEGGWRHGHASRKRLSM